MTMIYKDRINSNGQQLHQYQQNEETRRTSIP